MKHASKIHTIMPIECIDCARHIKKRNQMVNLMVTETSTHNQVTYCHRNRKSQLVLGKPVKQLYVPIQAPVAKQYAPTFLATL